MKITVTLKDPDGFYESVKDAVADDVATLGLPTDESELVAEARTEKAWDAIKRWVEYKEYVVIEFDTEADTATVKERA